MKRIYWYIFGVVIIIILLAGIILFINFKRYENNRQMVYDLGLESTYYYPNYIVGFNTINEMNDDLEFENDRLDKNIDQTSKLIQEDIGLQKEDWDENIQNSKTKDPKYIYSNNLEQYYSDLKEKEEKNRTCKETYIDDILIVNKQHCLPKSYNPGGLTKQTQEAFDKMQAGAKKDGITINIQSGFRSYEYQEKTYNGWKEKYGKKEADRISARPGYSEHQTGMAFDVSGVHGCTLNKCFINTPEGKWIDENAYKYGFIVRYPKGKENITGYDYEPWHLRYVGVDPATQMYKNDETLEQYLGLKDQAAY